MAPDDGNSTLRLGSGSLVDGLARSVISRVTESTSDRLIRRVDSGACYLIDAALSEQPFVQEEIFENLVSRRISAHEIMDHCIVRATEELGQGWVDDRYSFALVSSASARIFGLCKFISSEWEPPHRVGPSAAILLVTLEREDHIIGSAVLADQVRRRGHSVRLLNNTSIAEIRAVLGHSANNAFDAIFFSSGSLGTLATSAEAIKTLREDGWTDLPMLLGGAGLNALDQNFEAAGANLVTNDLDSALELVMGDAIRMKVAE